PESSPNAGGVVHSAAWAHSRRLCASRARCSLRANISITPSVCSAIATAWMPRPFVTTMSLSTSAGNRSEPTPVAVSWIHLSLSARGKLDSRTAQPSTMSASGSPASASSRVRGALNVIAGNSPRSRTGSREARSLRHPGSAHYIQSRSAVHGSRAPRTHLTRTLPPSRHREPVRARSAPPSRRRPPLRHASVATPDPCVLPPPRIRVRPSPLPTHGFPERLRSSRRRLDPSMNVRIANGWPGYVLAPFLLLACGTCWADPWGLKPGEFYSEVRGSEFSTETAYASTGDRVLLRDDGSFESRGMTWASELGWKKRVSFR